MEYYKHDIEELNEKGKKGKLANAYASIIYKLWNKRDERIETYELKEQISAIAEQFGGYIQQDSEEFVTFLLNGLHEDLKREIIREKKIVTSIIMELFSGKIITKVRCPNCSHIVNKLETFLIISVPIPLFKTLNVFIVPSKIGASCIKKHIVVQNDMTLGDISPKLGLSGEFIYGFVKDGKLTEMLSETENATEIAEEIYDLFAFEFNYNEEGKTSDNIDNYYPLEIQVSERNTFYYSRNAHRRPLIIPVKKSMSITDFKVNFFRKLAPYFKELNGKTPKELVKINDTMAKGYNPRFELSIVEDSGKCEFCNQMHYYEDCPFSFNDEDKHTMDEVIQMLDKRRLKLSLKLQDNTNSQMFIKNLEELPTEKFLANRNLKQSEISIYDCFDAFSKEEKLDKENLWDCENCKKKVQATKNAMLYDLPPILIIHLKRFKQKMFYHYSTSKKIKDFVTYPIEGLDLSRFVETQNKTQAKYNLYGVTNHWGETNGGHYVAVCKNPIEKIWVYFDDNKLYKARDSEIVSSSGYILYYRRADL